MTVLEWRPRTRRDCEDGPRPCPWLSCRHHLIGVTTPLRRALRRCNPTRRREWDRDEQRWHYLDADECEQRLLWAVEMAGDTCVLDVIDAHPRGMSLGAIGEVLGVCRQRAEQELDAALERFAATKVRGAL